MNAIVYTSNTGFTAQYAGLLGEKLNLPAYSLDTAKRELAAGAEIIYLGWLMDGQVKGYKQAAKLYKIAAVCGVGMGAGSSQIKEVRKGNTIPKNVPLFTLQGGFELNKLHGIYKFMMNTMECPVHPAGSPSSLRRPAPPRRRCRFGQRYSSNCKTQPQDS